METNQMTLAELIASALKSPSSPNVQIYWDKQDRNNAGPAFRETNGNEDRTTNESGPLDISGWAHVSGRKVEESEVVGYDLADYFRGIDGAYQGPNSDGIYPVLS